MKTYDTIVIGSTKYKSPTLKQVLLSMGVYSDFIKMLEKTNRLIEGRKFMRRRTNYKNSLYRSLPDLVFRIDNIPRLEYELVEEIACALKSIEDRRRRAKADYIELLELAADYGIKIQKWRE